MAAAKQGDTVWHTVEGAPPSVQDRAYTSPLWYTPGM